jgi:hypothetical protein
VSETVTNFVTKNLSFLNYEYLSSHSVLITTLIHIIVKPTRHQPDAFEPIVALAAPCTSSHSELISTCWKVSYSGILVNCEFNL